MRSQRLESRQGIQRERFPSWKRVVAADDTILCWELLPADLERSARSAAGRGADVREEDEGGGPMWRSEQAAREGSWREATGPTKLLPSSFRQEARDWKSASLANVVGLINRSLMTGLSAARQVRWVELRLDCEALVSVRPAPKKYTAAVPNNFRTRRASRSLSRGSCLRQIVKPVEVDQCYTFSRRLILFTRAQARHTRVSTFKLLQP